MNEFVFQNTMITLKTLLTTTVVLTKYIYNGQCWMLWNIICGLDITLLNFLVCTLYAYWAWFFVFWSWSHIDLIWISDFAYDVFVALQESDRKSEMYIRSMLDLPISEKQRTRVIIWNLLGLVSWGPKSFYNIYCFLFFD